MATVATSFFDSVKMIAAEKGIPEEEVYRAVEEALVKVTRFPYETKSSTQLDYERGGWTEVDLFMGYAVRAGRSLGIPVPLHEELYAALKKGDAGKA